VTPPDFYVPGEGLMTWKNIVTDNGSYDLNPTVGEVTIRVCSVRAAETAETRAAAAAATRVQGQSPPLRCCLSRRRSSSHVRGSAVVASFHPV
jgi:hypothetical protein